MSTERKKDFLRKIVEEDLEAGKYKEVVTRFPPEPNGFPHIGHAKSITLNFGIARDYGGRCHLRMDDTNPETEDEKYVEAIKDAVRWLGFEWDGPVRYTSDYFQRLYDYAVQLIKMGKAYVDSLSEEEIREYRGTVTTPGRRSKYAERSVEENLELFERMKKGEFAEGEHVLRAKIDMASPNMKMRDPLLYRIRRAPHYRTGTEWAVYPMYDFAHCLSDYIEGITHSFCTLEFENNREIYDWILDTLQVKPPRPHQYEFARLNLSYTVMSKRKLLELVDKGIVSGWDDPRMPTIAGYRRRGYTPESILTFCEQIGIAKANSVVDVAQLEFCIRDDLNPKVPRVMCVVEPLKITIANYEGEGEELDAPYYPHDVPKEGSRKLPFGKHLYIDRKDFEENPPKGYNRLTPKQPVRLRYAYIIRCKEVVKNDQGEIVEIVAEYYPDSKSGEDSSGIKVKSAIHWVEATHAKKVMLRLYDRLYRVEQPESIDDINPDSLKVVKNALIEPAVIDEKPDERYQFEREGYFYADPIDYTDEAPVFNRIVTLKDSWAKKQKKQKPTPKPQKEPAPKPAKPQPKSNELPPMEGEQKARYERYKALGLREEMASTLARDEALTRFFDEALQTYDRPENIAKLVVNEVARELKQRGPNLPFTPAHIARVAKMLDEERISTKIAKQLFEEMAQSGEEPESIVEQHGWVQITDPAVLTPVIDEVIAANPENVKKYKEGNERLFGFFVGQVLKATGGKANPKVVNALVRERLGG